MRRFLFGVVIASVATAMPSWAFGGDREIAKAVMADLQQHKSAGSLKGFDLDMQVEDGVVYLDGHVATRTQRNLVAQAAAKAVGVGNIVNNIRIVPSKVAPPQQRPVRKTAVRQASTTTTTATPVRQAAARVAPQLSDSQVTDAVIGKLQQLKSSNQLRGFQLDVNAKSGDLWLSGKVANAAQKSLVLESARRVRGVKRVVDDIKVASSVRTASTGGLQPAQTPPTPVQQGSSMPTGQPRLAPQPFAQASTASAPMAGVPSGMPVAMNAGAQFGGGAPRYDQPNMPSYAWPSYAAHPNYAAVSYPKQYSPSAWPYIGPFYPYPQVPLGWRKVALEWDDGLWYLDFTSK